jgi:hypothetical protein
MMDYAVVWSERLGCVGKDSVIFAYGMGRGRPTKDFELAVLNPSKIEIKSSYSKGGKIKSNQRALGAKLFGR